MFNKLIKKPDHKYPTKFNKSCSSLKAFSLKAKKYCISYCGPKTSYALLTKKEKELKSSVFRKNCPFKTSRTRG